MTTSEERERQPGGELTTPSSSPPQEASPVALNGRVLLIEDDDLIRKLLAKILSRDHEVVAVASGVEAKALLEADRAFEAILCDLVMPELSGTELHSWLAQEAPELAGRFALMTGRCFSNRVEAYIEREDIPILWKPFDAASARAKVRELLRRKGARSARSP